jgi:hypothetical protein
MDPPKAERFLRATTNGTTVDGMLQPFGNPPPALDGTEAPTPQAFVARIAEDPQVIHRNLVDPSAAIRAS